jgi:hypothetical protein
MILLGEKRRITVLLVHVHVPVHVRVRVDLYFPKSINRLSLVPSEDHQLATAPWTHGEGCCRCLAVAVLKMRSLQKDIEGILLVPVRVRVVGLYFPKSINKLSLVPSDDHQLTTAVHHH